MLMSFLLAAQAATGITDTPCPPPAPMPVEIAAWRAQVYAPGNAKMLPPPAAAAVAYRNAYIEARKTDWADLCRYRADNARLAGTPQEMRDVVFMGDSITEAWALGDPALFARGWIDRGISGQTTPQMLLRFPADVLALRPRVVHIMAGTNDIAGNTGPTTLDAVEGNIAAMVTLAKAAGVRVVLAATPPAATFRWQPAMTPTPQIAALNMRLRALAARERVTFVDYAPAIGRADGAMRDDFSLDGVHPNAAGYAAMRSRARAAIVAARR